MSSELLLRQKLQNKQKLHKNDDILWGVQTAPPRSTFRPTNRLQSAHNPHMCPLCLRGSLAGLSHCAWRDGSLPLYPRMLEGRSSRLTAFPVATRSLSTSLSTGSVMCSYSWRVPSEATAEEGTMSITIRIRLIKIEKKRKPTRKHWQQHSV